MTKLVLPDTAERQVFFQKGCDTDPFGVLLTHQVLVIGERQNPLANTRRNCDHDYSCSVLSRSALRRAATSAPS